MQQQSEQLIVLETKDFVKKTLESDCTGHDWWHVYRVWRTAKHIAKHERVNGFIVELGALLHDIADWKFNDGDTQAGAKKSAEWLSQFNLNQETINAVCDIVNYTSFKGAQVEEQPLSPEAQVVQDADRLDALGAIGIARTFAYGGAQKRPIYDPNEAPIMHETFQQYQQSKGTTINHFYEKLLLLKDRMNTVTGKQLAAKRHEFLENFLAQFFIEWQAEYE